METLHKQLTSLCDRIESRADEDLNAGDFLHQLQSICLWLGCEVRFWEQHSPEVKTALAEAYASELTPSVIRRLERACSRGGEGITDAQVLYVFRLRRSLYRRLDPIWTAIGAEASQKDARNPET